MYALAFLILALLGSTIGLVLSLHWLLTAFTQSERWQAGVVTIVLVFGCVVLTFALARVLACEVAQKIAVC